MPSDHLGLEGKRMQLHPRSPLGGLVWSGEASKPDWARNLVVHRWTLHQRGGDTGTLTLRCVTTWPGVWTPLDSPLHCTVPYQGFLIWRPNKRNKRLLFNIVDWLTTSIALVVRNASVTGKNAEEIRTRLVDHLTSHLLSFVTHESRPGSTLSVSL